MAGRAWPVTDPARVAQLARSARAAPQVDWRLFEFTVDVAMLARREQHSAGVPGGAPGGPAVQVWLDPHAPPAASEQTALPQSRPVRRSRDVQRSAA